MKENIIGYYSPELKDARIILRADGKEKSIPMYSEKVMYLTFGQMISSEEEAIEKGILSMKCCELAKLLFPAEYEAEYYNHHIDKRSQDYLDAVRQNIGLLEIGHGWDEEKFETTEKHGIWMNAEDVEVGKLEDGRWIAQYSIRTAVDDYDICRIYFSKNPSRDSIVTAHAIEDIEIYLSLDRRYNPKFRCWECGIEQHWLDIRGAEMLEDKYRQLKEKYCGC